MAQTRRQKNDILRAQLEAERSSFIPTWRDCGEQILPRRPRFFVSDANKGDRRNQKIIDSTATLAARTLRSGMMGGVTSPARPWFRLSTPDPSMAEFGPVKEWLHLVTQRMSYVLMKSNYYNVKPIVYGDLGVFGTAAYSIEEDFQSVIRCNAFPVGSYMIAKDYRGMINVFVRDFRMTVRQLVEQFGQTDDRTGRPMWEMFSSQVKSLWGRGEYETWIDVRHILKPNENFDPRRLDSKFKKFSSCYYEVGSASGIAHYDMGDDDRFLSEKGYDYFPVLCPRWEVSGEDVYGTSCPGVDALGDTKALQLMHKRKAEAIEKMVRPPMTAPSSLRNQKASILPGDVTYVDTHTGQNGFKPAYEVNPRIAELTADIREHQQRVQRAFFEDLFLMLATSDRRQITAREIDERHEEKLLALGPVMEQLNQDDLDPTIDITFDMMMRQEMLPPPPDELAGVDLKVEYISVMAQAQKLVGIAGIERFAGFVGNIAGVHPPALQKVDIDQMIDEYGDAVGISPRIVRTDEAVAEMRAQEAKAQQAQATAAMLQQGAGAAKDLSQADMEGDNALTRILKQAEAGQLAPRQ